MHAAKKPVTHAPSTMDEAVQAIRNLMPDARNINISITRDAYTMEIRADKREAVAPSISASR